MASARGSSSSEALALAAERSAQVPDRARPLRPRAAWTSSCHRRELKGSRPLAYEQILTDVSEGVLTITLNRPDRLNAWTGQMGEELRAAFDESDADDEVRAVIVTGAGRGFCAGADLRAAATPSTTASATPRARRAATTAANSRCGCSTRRSP